MKASTHQAASAFGLYPGGVVELVSFNKKRKKSQKNKTKRQVRIFL